MRLAGRPTLLAGVLTSLAALTAPACNNAPVDPSSPEAISNRPQQYDRFIAILRLKTPALLAGVAMEDGRPKVDAARAAALEAEQQRTLDELRAISPEIQVLYRYKHVLNGIAIAAPRSLEGRFRQMAEVSYVESESAFVRPATVTAATETLPPGDLGVTNSSAWIGATRVWRELTVNGAPVDGRGTTVGVIDTGIDYTHTMFGGPGSVEVYQAVDPRADAPGLYPNAKVVGGIDLVGEDYDAASPNFDHHIPRPDANPIDLQGHGTHVAGTIAGRGDLVRSYDGVAPEAGLHAIKVFANGSTGDSVIIAALEYSADPNGDGNPVDRLDVVNLSLGSGYGTPHILYTEAVKNLAAAGTVPVISAGNSGPNPFIVGAPGTSDEAISVAASIDDMEHNWKFPTVAFSADGLQEDLVAEAVEASFTKPLAEVEELKAPLAYIGDAAQPLTPEQVEAVRGKVALIDRGVVTFSEKITRAAEAGAIGVVMANNVDGAPSAMGGDARVEIPAVMISKALGDRIKPLLAAGSAVVVDFKSPVRLEKPELIDTITSFSSQGPRSVDGHIKPEVAAPGYQIWSAKNGGGNATVALNGTSMAAPHVAGVAALLRQLRPADETGTIKSLIVNTAKPIKDAGGLDYTIARTGAGRVRAFEAATAALAFHDATVSLGEVLVESQKTVQKTVRVTALGEAQDVTVEWTDVQGLAIEAPRALTLAAGETATLPVRVTIKAPASDAAAEILEAFLTFKSASGDVLGRVPMLAIARRVSRLAASDLVVQATSEADAANAVASVTLRNGGRTTGDALLFNLLGRDERAAFQGANAFRRPVCDLQSAGYRVTNGKLQIAVKLYNPITSWQLCEVSVQIDGDGDGVADQELLGTHAQTLTQNAAQEQTFLSILTDASKMRALRAAFEAQWGQPNGTRTAVYTDAIVDTQPYLAFGHSTVSVVSADLAKVAKTSRGDLRVKVAVLPYRSSHATGDDYLATHAERWATIPLTRDALPFVDLPERLTVAAGATESVSLTKGGGRGQLVSYFPHNATSPSATRDDEQQQVLRARYANAPR